MKPTAKPRQRDVAARAGVSPAIVSLVLNGRLDGGVRISERTQRRVWEAIRELGYVPDPVARSLAGGRNGLLGVFTYEAVFPVESRDFYYPFLVGIEQEAEAQDYDLLLFTRAGGETGRRAVYRDGVNRLRLADGAVLLGRDANRDELARLHGEGYPFVFIGRREAPGTELSYVAADYVEATGRVVEHLAALGHRRLAYLRSRSEAEASADRETGFRAAHESLGLPLSERPVLRLEPEAVTPELVRARLESGVTAFVAEDPPLALRAIAAARALGLDVPEDLSVAVLGGSERDSSAAPELTTFSIPRQEMGAAAVRLLARVLANPHEPGPHRVVLPCALAPGRTTAAPPSVNAS